MTIVRPRLVDYYNVPITQEEVDFAIPFLDEDIPLYLDPFLLWKSPSQQDNALHLILINTFNMLGTVYSQNEDKREVIVRCTHKSRVSNLVFPLPVELVRS